MSRPRRNKDIEKDLMEAIDRLLAAGDDVNHSSVTREANRARGLLSKGTSGYAAVRERIAEIRGEASPPHAIVPKDQGPSLRSQVQALIKVNRELKCELTNVRSGFVALLVARADSDRLEPQVADMQRRQAGRAERLAAENVIN